MSDQARTSGPELGSPPGADPALDESTRSEAACPSCGAHRLALLNLPRIDINGYRPIDEIYGMINGPSPDEPGIGCLACGAEWPDLATFNDAVAEGAQPNPGA